MNKVTGIRYYLGTPLSYTPLKHFYGIETLLWYHVGASRFIETIFQSLLIIRN